MFLWFCQGICLLLLLDLVLVVRRHYHQLLLDLLPKCQSLYSHFCYPCVKLKKPLLVEVMLRSQKLICDTCKKHTMKLAFWLMNEYITVVAICLYIILINKDVFFLSYVSGYRIILYLLVYLICIFPHWTFENSRKLFFWFLFS